MIAWKAELGRSFARAAARKGRPFGGRRPLAEAEPAGLEYEILRVLWHDPRHGYGIMEELAKERGSRPSPEAVYPALQMLEEGDFVTGRLAEGKRVYALAPKGSEFLANGREPERARRRDPGADAPFAKVHPIARGLRGPGGPRAPFGLRSALREIARTRDAELYADALAIVERALLELRTLLARR
jgi:DNA-binding PadR family transcriptional regulator